MESKSQVIRLPEKFDFDHHKTFTEQYKQALSHHDCDRIVLEFRDVEYLDSSALGLMVLLHREAANQGVRVAIQGATGVSKDILSMANMQKLYEVSD